MVDEIVWIVSLWVDSIERESGDGDAGEKKS